ncbi:MAG: hypothetical protein WBH08_03850 [Methanothrix sp.]|uniref:hypothetical protein n=1 Tax=Methanothrix sp. TaxID=90426 RepID=UPI003BB565F4
MSDVRDFYRDHHSNFDDLHKLLDKEPGLLAQLSPLRARALSCCGAVPGKGSELKLAVVDPDGWDATTREQEAVMKKLDAIDTMVNKLDGIFAEMDAAGIETKNKTVREIWAIEQSKRTQVIDPHTCTNVDHLGHRIPPKQDAQLVAWGERANAALQEAQAVVDGQQAAQPSASLANPWASPLTELAEKAKSLFA